MDEVSRSRDVVQLTKIRRGLELCLEFCLGLEFWPLLFLTLIDDTQVTTAALWRLRKHFDLTGDLLFCNSACDRSINPKRELS
jgi:hypothetical protein